MLVLPCRRGQADPKAVCVYLCVHMSIVAVLFVTAGEKTQSKTQNLSGKEINMHTPKNKQNTTLPRGHFTQEAREKTNLTLTNAIGVDVNRKGREAALITTKWENVEKRN